MIVREEVYYNEFDKTKCAELKALQEGEFIREGTIDDRSIRDVQPGDVNKAKRAHFFAGIGLWDNALDLAKWPEDIPVWTGSCPCQPFSTAGRQKGKEDDRHLWPEWERLIIKCRPPVIFGEQVNGAITKGWLDDVYKGLEAQGYAVGTAVLPACSVGAPHKRDRIYFVAYLQGEQGYFCNAQYGKKEQRKSGGRCRQESLGDAKQTGSYETKIRQSYDQTHVGSKERKNFSSEFKRTGCNGSIQPMASADGQRSQGQRKLQRSLYTKKNKKRETNWSEYDCSGNWKDAEWIECPDGKQRLIKPGIQLLADGNPYSVDLLHAAGDGIVRQVAAEFIMSFMEIINGE